MTENPVGPTPVLYRAAASAAGIVGLLSLVYAVFYLFVAPSVQRGSNVDAALRSYVSNPTGLRVASLCLLVSGLLTTVVYAALHAVPGELSSSVRTWALALGAVSGTATAAHGLADLIDLDKVAQAYVNGDAATQAAATVVHATVSQVDPRGLATFGIVGVVIFVFSRHVRERNRFVAVLGQILGVDMVLLFLASAFTSTIAILITGGLASVVLGPLWWVSVGLWLYRGAPATV
jgi:hypothetical protein